MMRTESTSPSTTGAGDGDRRPRPGPSAMAGTAVVIAITVASIIGAAIGASGCATTAEGLDVAQLPVDVRPDYTLFARRCSKCHALTRALNSGISDDSVWVNYVNRMRRQPGSGIAPQDMAPILRFLHYYTLEQQRRKRTRDAAAAGAAPSANASVIPGQPGQPDR